MGSLLKIVCLCQLLLLMNSALGLEIPFFSLARVEPSDEILIHSRSSTLDFFKRHQSPEGMWDVDGYQTNCTIAGPKCEPGERKAGTIGDLGVTSLVILSFLGSGYDHNTPNQYRQVVRRALDWLLTKQLKDGSFGDVRNDENAIATLALCEVYAMTLDPTLKSPAQGGVDFLLSVQGDDGAWDHRKPTDRQDASISAWCIMALKSAKGGGLNIQDGLGMAKVWFETTWKGANAAVGLNPQDPEKDISIFPQTVHEGKFTQITPGDLSFKEGARTSLGLCIGAFLGYGRDSLIMQTMANEVMRTHVPRYEQFQQINQHWLLFNSYGMLHVGAEKMKSFFEIRDQSILKAYRSETGCFDGSWDWDTPGNTHPWRKVGRLLSTAYCTLALQVRLEYIPWKTTK